MFAVESTEGVSQFTREVISALGYLPLLGNSKFDFSVRRLPGVSPNPPFSPALDWTDIIFVYDHMHMLRCIPVDIAGGVYMYI